MINSYDWSAIFCSIVNMCISIHDWREKETIISNNVIILCDGLKLNDHLEI